MTKSQTETSDEFNRRWLNVTKKFAFIFYQDFFQRINATSRVNHLRN